MKKILKNDVQVNGRIHLQTGSNEIYSIEIATESTNPYPLIITAKSQQNIPENNLNKLIKVNGYLIENSTIQITSFSSFNEIFINNECRYSGKVKLIKKFSFSTKSNMYLLRCIFKTENEFDFQAVALRRKVKEFENISEGDSLNLSATYVVDNSGKPPYWKIKGVSK